MKIEYTIKKAGNQEIAVLADGGKPKEDISHAARNEGWMLKEIESEGDSYRITIAPTLVLPP